MGPPHRHSQAQWLCSPTAPQQVCGDVGPKFGSVSENWFKCGDVGHKFGSVSESWFECGVTITTHHGFFATGVDLVVERVGVPIRSTPKKASRRLVGWTVIKIFSVVQRCYINLLAALRVCSNVHVT